jgi:aspartyl protease family protein
VARDLTAEDRQPFAPDSTERYASLRIGAVFSILAAVLIGLGLADEPPRGSSVPAVPETPLSVPPSPSKAPPASDPTNFREPSEDPRPAHSLLIPENGSGQFEAPCRFNDTELRCYIDTGASEIVLDRPAARRAGVDITRLRFDGTAQTANGTVRTAAALVATLRVGPFELHDVSVAVDETDLGIPLLGMSFLRRYRMTVSDGALTLTD